MTESISQDPTVAKHLLVQGATLVFLDVPPRTEFGIDMNVYNVGEKFRGVKLIPPGLHFIYYSAVNKEGQTAPRTGFFHFFSPKELLVKKWDSRTEDISQNELSDEEKQRIDANLHGDLDRFLGVFPYKSWKTWIGLTGYITEPLLRKLEPESGKIQSVTQLVPQSYPPKTTSDDTDSLVTKRLKVDLEERLLPTMVTQPGTSVQFTVFPEHRYPAGSTPSEITAHGMDSTFILEEMFQNCSVKDEILGELQMAFICFLVGQLYDSFEQWKRLLRMICNCDSGIEKYPDFFSKFIRILHFELQHVPSDFFVDIVSGENFLTDTLQVFFSNISGDNVDKSLYERGQKFKESLVKKFKWDFDSEPDDCAPVVVEL